jgi:endonuclease YncB( thermonuclease family)
MRTRADRILPNAGPRGRSRSDEERRAMFARMRGRGTVTRGTLPESEPIRTPTAQEQRVEAFVRAHVAKGGTEAEARQTVRAMEDMADTFALGAAGGGGWGRIGKAALTSILSGSGASAIGGYRERNPTMDPRKERALAKAESLLGTVSALSGLAAAKGGARKAAPGSFSKADAWLGKAGAAASRAAGSAASKLPAGLRSALSKLKAGYDALAGVTGNELPSLKQIPEAGKLLAARSRGVVAIRTPGGAWEGTTLAAAKKLVGPAVVAGGMTAIEIGEQKQIDRYKDEIGERWGLGYDWDLPADPDPFDIPGMAGLNFLLGTLGNPLEKQLRSYYGGRYTKDLADIAAYELQYDRIGEMERRGLLDAEGAEAARSGLAEWKPWNMAGRSVYTFTPAAANFLKWKASEFTDSVTQPQQFGKVAEVLDADTIRIEGGNPKGIRLTGINAPEIDHGPGKPAEYLGPEATRWQTDQLLGKVVRIVQNPDALTEKYGRDLGFVETLPGPLDSLLQIPGLNRILPAVDQNKKTLAEGYAAPKKEHERLPGGKHARLAGYDRTVADAIAREVGVHSAEGREKYPHRYTPTRTNAPGILARASTLAGLGLMTSGQSGAFRALGPAGNAAAQTWNAGMSALGTWQHAVEGNANTGRVYRLPTSYVTDYQIIIH